MTAAFFKSFAFGVLILAAGAVSQASAKERGENPAAVLPVVHYHTVQIDGTDIFYREAGPKDGPAIVLMHGFPTSSHNCRGH